MFGNVAGAMAAAIVLSGVGWLGLAGLSYSSALTGPICGAGVGSFGKLLPDLLLAWGLMVLAMMGPLLAGPLHHLWHRSLARHRVQAIGLFLLTYVSAWCVVCLIFAMVLDAASANRISDAATLPVTILAAAIWQLLPEKRNALLRCHLRPPLAVFGARAWLDPITFGLRFVFWCVTSCWALMLVCVAAQAGGIWLMPVASAIIGYERLFSARARPFGSEWRAWISWAQSAVMSLERPA